MPESQVPQQPLDLTGIPFVPARHFTAASRDQVALLVLHCMESQEKPGTARRVAEWATRPCSNPKCDRCPRPVPANPGPYASWGYAVDAVEVIRSVRDEDIAWHAPGANSNGIGIEHAGRASQSEGDWADDYSRAVLELSIRLAAALCRRWDIPAEIVDPFGLVAGEHGITTHAFVSKAFPKRSNHTDPGEHFPLTWYVARVRAELEAGR